MEIIGYVISDFTTKFGAPRQSGIIEGIKSKIIFKPEYSHPDAFRRLDEFSHIWVIWEFSKAKKQGFSETVRPPRLGGNTRVGVFASRSPFRPNSIGLSCVKLDKVELTETEGTILHISGADMIDGTPVYDIKPYLPYADSKPDATGGYTDFLDNSDLQVELTSELTNGVASEVIDNLIVVLKNDPRPSYQNDPDRIYGMDFAGINVKFKVNGNTLTVISLEKI